MQNVQGDNQGNAFFEMNPMKGCSSTSIKLRALDDYWNYVLKQEHVFLMKIDVQGFEGFVFQGGVEMFKSKPPPFIFMEFSPERYRNYGVDTRSSNNMQESSFPSSSPLYHRRQVPAQSTDDSDDSSSEDE